MTRYYTSGFMRGLRVLCRCVAMLMMGAGIWVFFAEADNRVLRGFAGAAFLLGGIALLCAGSRWFVRWIYSDAPLSVKPSAPADFRSSADQNLARLLEAAPDAMVVVDGAGKILLINAQTERLFGYRREELLGREIEVLVPERFRVGHLARRGAFARESWPRPMGAALDLFALNKDGHEFPVEISLSPLKTGDEVRIFSVIRDISAHKLIEEQLARQARELAQSNTELEQFAYVASHDLQEPLRVISSYTQLLARRYKGQLDPKADEFITFIVDGTLRMQRLIQDLLQYARINTKEKTFFSVESQSAFDHALTSLRSAIAAGQATVTSDPLPAVNGDELQLGQLFQNLIGNAIKYRGPEPPRVHVSARRDGDEWIFTVADNGIGIDPQFGEQIFEIFQRLHGMGEYEGTGIGLALCRKIVERHHGRIWVESEPGQGAKFRFTLPAGTKRAQAEEAAPLRREA